jgi:uncharacterized protein YkwD
MRASLLVAFLLAQSCGSAPAAASPPADARRASLSQRSYASEPTPFAVRAPAALAPDFKGLARVAENGRRGDGRLSDVAARIAEQGPESCDDVALLMSLTRAAGLPNPLPQALCVAASSAALAGQTLADELPKTASQLGTTHVGIGAATTREGVTAVALLDTRKLVLAPLPRRLDAPGAIDVSVHVLAPLRNPRLVLTTPSGATHVLVEARGAELKHAVQLDAPGLYGLEVVATGRHGPEVAANLRIAVAVDEPDMKPMPRADRAMGAAQFEHAVVEALATTRRERGLGALARKPELDAVARAHAEDMQARGYFGHVDAQGRGPMERIELAGLRASAVHENLARVATPLEAHTLWLESPAHRAAMLANDAHELGVGAVRAGDGAFHVVALYAQLGPARAQPAARTRGQRPARRR